MVRVAGEGSEIGGKIGAAGGDCEDAPGGCANFFVRAQFLFQEFPYQAIYGCIVLSGIDFRLFQQIGGELKRDISCCHKNKA
ncbi:MAG TPA: hypothetical protein VKG79_08485 [Bryobacteraceae bacterium]|nr:hypothetical protein [Bryobacteraceae bacterium]